MDREHLILAIEVMNVAWMVATLVGMGKCLQKAGKAGWAVLVPFYNLVVLLRVAGMSGWWTASLLLVVIPIAGPLAFAGILIWWHIRIAERFSQGVGFALGMTFLSPIFWCILGFGDSTYRSAIPAAK